MLIRALQDHFQGYFVQAADHNTILWFDPEREYTALLDHLAGIPLWRYDGSLLQLRYRLVQRAVGERVVVYLPLFPEGADVLRPFFATSLVYHERLYRLLRKQGLNLPDDPQVAHELRNLLPRLAARSVGKGRAFWEYNLANLERARETLLGNFDDALLRFLAQPAVELVALQKERLDGLFFAQLESAYGLAAAPDQDPAETAGRLTAQLVLVRAFVSVGQPEGFPFAERLPEPLYFDRNEAFLDRWQRDSTFKAAYLHLAGTLAKQYNLAGWVGTLPLPAALALGATFCNVEEALWQQVVAAMAGLASEADWRSWLAEYRAQWQTRAASFWAREGRAGGWALLARAADLLAAIQEARAEVDRLATPAAVLQRYSASWWQIDHDFRLLREAIDAQATPGDALRERCALAYRDILERMNARFSTLLGLEQQWPPSEALPAQDSLWADIAGTLRPGQRVAFIFVDALRYELAWELWNKLETEGVGTQRRLSARLAAIPTVTPIGMAALLPEGQKRQVGYSDSWDVTIADSGNLRAKGARQQWLVQHLPGVHCCNLEDLLNTPVAQLPAADAYAVFDNTLDAIGESASQVAWNLLGQLLLGVKKGVHKLLELGVQAVHIVTDHGFLLLEEVKEHEKVGVRDVPALAKKSRYVVGRQLGKTEQLAFPVPGSADLEAWFPRGIGCFRTPGAYNYVHGGLSLQELVVPHLQIVQESTGQPVGVRVDLPQEIRNGQFGVRVTPVTTELFARARQVSLALEKEDRPVVPPLSAVIGPGDAIEIQVLLPMGCGLQPRDRVRWVLCDALTDEVLAEQEAINYLNLG